MTLVSIMAQQDAQYTQYMYNTMSVNPAYAGSRGAISILGLYRSQWVGLDGAPRTQTFSIHSPLGISEQTGLGFSVINDDIGATHETYFDVTFSYTISFPNEKRLAFGVKGGGHLLNVNFTKLRQYDLEFTGEDNIRNKFSPNVGVGLYYYSDQYYIGLSVPNLLRTKHFDEATSSSAGTSTIATERLHYYLIGGYVFNLSEKTKFKPAALVKAVSGAPLSVDISANFMFNHRFILGAAYRWDAAVSALAGFQITPNLLLGYAYDAETTRLGNTEFQSGSHEIMLRYELFRNSKRLLSPRFF